MTNMEYIVKALTNLRPGAGWSLTNDQYNGLIWQDTNYDQPSALEVTAEIARLRLEYTNTEYQRLRAPEYPPITDYLDGVVKGDQAQMQAYIDACQAVKDKYPKPEGV